MRQELAESVDSGTVFATRRMYRNGVPQIRDEQVFGITTFEQGDDQSGKRQRLRLNPRNAITHVVHWTWAVRFG
jgi:hypothetical protein